VTAPEPNRPLPTQPADPPTQPLLTVRVGTDDVRAAGTQVPGYAVPASGAGQLPGNDGRLAATPWTFVDVFAGLGVVLLLTMLVAAPLQFSNVHGGSALLLVSALPVWIGLLGTTFWASRRHGTGNLVRDLALRFRPLDLAIGLGAGLGLRFVIGIWTVAYSAMTGQRPTGNLDAVIGDGLGTGIWLVINVAVIALVGPAIEEIFFRGLGLRSALASAWRRAGLTRFADPKRRIRYSIAATSLIFALLHLSEVNDLTSAVVLLPGLFLAGWVLGRLTVWSGRLGPAIVTHMVFNGVAVVALLAVS